VKEILARNPSVYLFPRNNLKSQSSTEKTSHFNSISESRLLEAFQANAYHLSDWLATSHSAYVAMSTESDGVKIDGLLPPNFL
jgi:hypothetical protein